jgi:phage tail protein X
MDQAAWKRALKEAAQVLYPDIKITLKTADAVLLMHYGLTQ